jgi:hypothetical protein
MIKNIYGNSMWIEVSTGNQSMPYINNTQPIAGMIRCNSMMQRLEVYDGNNWVEIGNGQAHIDLSEQAKQVLSWAYDKMGEENRLKELLAKHPGLKDLNDKFEIMKVLCQEEENQQ